MNLLTVLGTRPEVIKMLPLIRELHRRGIRPKICASGQQREILYSALSEFSIFPDVNLKIYKKVNTLSQATSAIILGVDNLLIKDRPDCIIVHGDTATALGAAMAAYYQKIPIAHIESGLRTFDIENPFPEEFNRRTIDNLSSLLFAPTEVAAQNLINEGIDSRKIFLTGNTVFDAAEYLNREDYTHPILEWARNSRLLLFTAHRRENIPYISSFCRAVSKLTEKGNVKVIFPCHPNPEIKRIAYQELKNNPKIALTPPLSSIDFHNILARCYFVLTDSGGVQEEAAYYKIPTLVLRRKSERTEAVVSGASRIVGIDESKIYTEAEKLLEDTKSYKKMCNAICPYTSGASRKIADALLKKLS